MRLSLPNQVKYALVATCKETDTVHFYVSDTGIGIPEDQKERIFERFYRVDKSHSKETGGTGLGLSIVKHGAILHNAEITVNSKVGEGTRMEILFEQDKSSD